MQCLHLIWSDVKIPEIGWVRKTIVKLKQKEQQIWNSQRSKFFNRSKILWKQHSKLPQQNNDIQRQTSTNKLKHYTDGKTLKITCCRKTKSMRAEIICSAWFWYILEPSKRGIFSAQRLLSQIILWKSMALRTRHNFLHDVTDVKICKKRVCQCFSQKFIPCWNINDIFHIFEKLSAFSFQRCKLLLTSKLLKSVNQLMIWRFLQCDILKIDLFDA